MVFGILPYRLLKTISNMKKNILTVSLFAALAMSFTACVNEEDDLFDQSAAERLNQSKATYTERFASSEAGWIMEYYPTNYDQAPQGLGYLLLADFNSDGSVKMAMNNRFSGNTYLEDTSLWEIISDTGPVLTFNTFNKCIHAFATPEDISFTGGALEDETGLGCEGDYEFIILNMEADCDTAMIKGKKRATYNRLTRLPEGTDFKEYMDDIKNFESVSFSIDAPNNLMMHFGADVLNVDSICKGIPNIYPVGTDAIANESFHPFITTKINDEYRIRFREPLTSSDGLYAQEFRFNEEANQFEAINNPEITITGPNPNTFFRSKMDESLKEWRFYPTFEMSEKMQAEYNKIRTSALSSNVTIKFISFKLSNTGQFQFNINYQMKKTATVSYNFDNSNAEDGVTLTYLEPAADNARNFMNAINGLEDFIKLFNGKFVVTPAESPFNLTNIRLASASDPDLWLTFQLR